MDKKKINKILSFDLLILIIIILLTVLLINKNEIINITTNSLAILKNKLTGNSSTTSEWNSDYITTVIDEDGIAVPVPKGYMASTLEGEHSVKDGFVIYETCNSYGIDNKDGINKENEEFVKEVFNQWVWVPVKDVNRIYTENNGIKKSNLFKYNSNTDMREELSINSELEPAVLKNADDDKIINKSALQGITNQKLNQMISLQYEEAMNSIKKYGGFYIGRYETGNVTSSYPVVVKNNKDLNNSDWYSMFEKMQYLGRNEFVKTNMIFGNLWDETLQWFIDNGSKTYDEIAKNSNTWGNYENAEFEYNSYEGELSTKQMNSSEIIPTGNSEYTKNCNIYDLAGNVDELTMESNGNKARVSRGGNYSSGENFFGVSSQAGSRTSGFNISLPSSSGYRAFMYIK